MVDLTPIFNAIIMLLAALVTYKVIPWIKANTTVKQQTALNNAVKIAVFAAEQLYNGSGMGAEKFDYVVSKLQEQGFAVDPAVIEATVRENIAALHATKTNETVNE